MSKLLKFILSIVFILSLFFASLYIKDFRIDASSDSLVSQNDEVLSQVSKEAHFFIKDRFSLNKSAESFYKDFEKVLSK